METIILSVDMKELEDLKGHNAETLAEKRRNLDEKFKNILSEKIKEMVSKYLDEDEKKNPEKIFKKNLKDLKIKNITIVIDGLTLSLILGNDDLEKKFLSLGFYSKSVV
jgi:hypothetical protein